MFDPATVSRSVAENTAAGQNVGAAVTATDTGDTLAYTLGGTDAASFDFVETSGQIRTKSGVSYDHEAKASYSVTVRASDGTATADATVTINVSDVAEPPAAPAAPTVAAVSGSTTSLTVSWSAPANIGKPAIANYDVQYRQGTSGDFTDGPQNVNGTSATITGLAADTLYQVQVHATNDEGDSDWSGSGSGTTNSAPNNASVFDPSSVTFMVAENTAAGQNIGSPVTATDADNDTLTYSLLGPQSAPFRIDGSTGQIRTNITNTAGRLDFETKPSFSFEIQADDGNGGIARGGVDIDLIDVDEPPAAPGAPSVAAVSGSTTSLLVSWAAPANAGKPAITSYDAQYRQGTSGNWTNGPQDVSGTPATITGLVADTLYQVQVKATNAEGDSGWSASGSGRTNDADNPPLAPTGLTLVQAGPSSIALSWTAPSNTGRPAVRSYDLQYRQGNSGNFTNGPQNVTTTSATISRLSASTTYQVQVRATNDDGDGPWSPSWTGQTGAAQPPGAPTNLRTTPGNGQVTLHWTAPTETGATPITHYEYEQNGDGTWHTTGGPATSHTVSGLTNGQTHTFRIRAVNSAGGSTASELRSATPSVPTDDDEGESEVSRETAPDAPRKLRADGKNGMVTLSWDAPESDGGAAITDYEYQIDGEGEWISIGSANRIHTITGLTNGKVYVFRVRAVNSVGRGLFSNRAKATPGAVLGFAHFANGVGIASEIVLVNVARDPIQPAIYFYDQAGDLVVAEDGSLRVHTEMEPLGQHTISTHGRGEMVSGSVRVVSGAPIGGLARYSVPGIGVAGECASQPIYDAIFRVRRQEGETNTGVALHNLDEEAMEVSCRLMQEGAVLEEVLVPLAAKGQDARFIQEIFTGADTSDFVGSVRCSAAAGNQFTAVALEMDAANRTFTTLPVIPLRGPGGRNTQTTLDFAHFANGAGIVSDLVFVNLSTQASRRAPTPFHSDILPSLPVLYFYDEGGDLIDPALVVDVTGDLVVTADGALTVQTEIEPLGVLTISTHGRGDLLSGSVKVASDGPIGGLMRFDIPGIGVTALGSREPVRAAVFPVRRQEGGINTGVALHNLESSPALVRCALMQEGVLLDAASIPLAANGHDARFIDEIFTCADTSDFVGLVRCDAVGEGLFTAVVHELDRGSRTFITVPAFPAPEMPSRE